MLKPFTARVSGLFGGLCFGKSDTWVTRIGMWTAWQTRSDSFFLPVFKGFEKSIFLAVIQIFSRTCKVFCLGAVFYLTKFCRFWFNLPRNFDLDILLLSRFTYTTMDNTSNFIPRTESPWIAFLSGFFFGSSIFSVEEIRPPRIVRLRQNMFPGNNPDSANLMKDRESLKGDFFNSYEKLTADLRTEELSLCDV